MILNPLNAPCRRITCLAPRDLGDSIVEFKLLSEIVTENVLGRTMKKYVSRRVQP